MDEKGSLILPIIDSDDRVNTGIANPIDLNCMFKPSQYLPLAGHFKPRAFDRDLTQKEAAVLHKLSEEEKTDGIASKRIYTLRFHNPIDPYNATHENIRRRGICESAMTKPFKAFTLGMEIGRRLIAESRGDIRVDDKELAEDHRKVINYQCPIHRRPCWCTSTDPEACLPILDQCTTETPFPMTLSCPFQIHTGRCFCLTGDDDDSSNFENLSVSQLNDLQTVQQQRDYLTECGVPCQDIDAPSPFEAEDEPMVILEMIPRNSEGSSSVVDSTEIPLAIRFIYIIPETSTVSFGGVIQSMIAEYGSKKRKSFKTPTQYQQHRLIQSRHNFLHLIGSVMWGKFDQYSNPALNKDFPLITSSEDNFVKGISQVLNFEYDLMSVRSSVSSVDKRNKNWQEVLHKDTAEHCFSVSSYFRGGKFCPSMKCQRNMLLLDSELLELKNDHHVLLKKYNLWHFLEQKEYYDRRFETEEGGEASLPSNTNTESSSGILRNPQSMTSELASNLNTDLFSNISETHQNRVRSSVRRWQKGQEGAGLNTFRYRQKMDLKLYEDEGRYCKTNEERREHYQKWLTNSIKSFKRYSSRQDLFLSTRGALDFVKKKRGVWNPIILGFKSLAAPSVGVGDMFIAELFYVSETLFYVSTHTGIVFFCYVCTADAFCTRLNKNNWIFKGAPDLGKSYTSNKVKDAMLIPETILMKTKQSDAALDDLDLMDYRNMMEEANMQLWYKNPKYSRIQDEEKNRLTSGVSIALKKQQFKGMDDIVRWHSQQIITIQSMQIGCSTNETQLEKKCIPAMLSRVPPKDMPKMKRIKGRRAVSDMNSAQSQQSSSKKRRSEQFCDKYRYYDSLRFLIYKCINLGVLTQPTRSAFDMILDKLKAHLKSLGISLDTRTEDRCYGKAVSLMILRIITTLFEFPKPRSDLMIVAMPFSDIDPWTLKDDDFSYKIHDDDMKRILSQMNVRDNFDDVRFVNSKGEVAHRLFVKMASEKAYDEKDKPRFFLRLIQQAAPPIAGRVYRHCPESLLGEFYKQWVSIHHSNFEHFIECVSPLMTISLEDTVRAIWMSRSEFVPDKLILFQKLLLRLGINCLKKDVLSNLGNEKKRKAMFKSMRVEVSEDNDYATDYSYIKLGKLKEVVAVLASDNAGKSEECNTYPEGFEVYFDRLLIRDMLEDYKSIRDTNGYYYQSPSRINEDNEPFFGVVKVSEGKLPDWDYVGPDGKVHDCTGTGLSQKWKECKPPKGFAKVKGKLSLDERMELKKAFFAKRQRKEKSASNSLEKWKVSTKHDMPVIEISDPSNSTRPGLDSSTVYLNINWIEKNFHTRNKKLEEVNPLILFFQSLGYRHDGIKITETQRILFEEKCRKRFEENCARFPEDSSRAVFQKQLENDLRRLRKQTLPEGSKDIDAGLKILLGSPFLGYTVNEKGEKEERTCTPQLSMSVTIHHTEEMWFTEAANVPSMHATDILNLPKMDSEKKRVDLLLPINDFATMKRLDFLCILEDDARVEDYKLLYDLSYKFPKGVYYPYRFASPNHIKGQIHSMYTKDYNFTTHYPHDAAYHEEKSYDCKRELINGQWVWVKYDYLKQKKAAGSSFRPELKRSIESRFGAIQEVVCEEEIEESQVEQRLNDLLIDVQDANRRNAEDNPEEYEDEATQGNRKHLRSSP